MNSLNCDTAPLKYVMKEQKIETLRNGLRGMTGHRNYRKNQI